MAKAVALKFKGSGIPYREEVNSTEFEEIESLGQDLKRFDFVGEEKQKSRALLQLRADERNQRRNANARFMELVHNRKMGKIVRYAPHTKATPFACSNHSRLHKRK